MTDLIVLTAASVALVFLALLGYLWHLDRKGLLEYEEIDDETFI